MLRKAGRFGWSRSGWGQLAQRETSLASVLTSMLRTHDMWTGFAVRYLDALVAHPALEGPELTLLQARLARRRDDVAQARALVRKVLEDLPGHQEALAFAQETRAPLPSAAARIAMERSE